MFKLLRMLVWLVLVLAVFAGIDQFLLRVPLEAPGLHQVQKFYVDFRGRLFSLAGIGRQNKSVEQVIESTVPSRTEPVKKGGRYLYVDKDGALQFADSLEEVPPRYRKDAQPLAE